MSIERLLFENECLDRKFIIEHDIKNDIFTWSIFEGNYAQAKFWDRFLDAQTEASPYSNAIDFTERAAIAKTLGLKPEIRGSFGNYSQR